MKPYALSQKQLNQMLITKDAIAALAEQLGDSSLHAIHEELGALITEVKAG